VANPKLYRILDNVKTALEGIKFANSYRRDVNEVVFTEDADVFIARKPDSIMIQDVIAQAESEPNATTTVSLTVVLSCLLFDGKNLFLASTILASDILKALKVDEERNRLAYGTDVPIEMQSTWALTGNRGLGGFTMNVQIDYDHTLADPDS
jgi:hypothetical protein